MSDSVSMRFYLKNAFDFEVRNKIETRMQVLNALDELNEEETDELKLLELVKEYLQKRIGEMVTT
jgi:hypothetical protein